MKDNFKSKFSNFFKRFRHSQSNKEEQRIKQLDLSEDGLLKTKSLEHNRRQVINRAQKYKVSLIETNRKVVVVSFAIVLLVIILFIGVMYWNLYKRQDYSAFSHNITKLIPIPVAKVGDEFVSYSQYLQELRRQTHYFETHYQIDFSNPEEEDFITLAELKNNAMQRVITKTYIKQLARKYNLNVTKEEVDEQFEVLRRQNKLGSTNQDIADVVNDFWGLTLEQYRMEVSDSLLQQKVIRKMDEVLKNNAYKRILSIKDELLKGVSFPELATQFSEDVTTARNGGVYNFDFTADTQEEHPLVVEAVFSTSIDGISEIIDTGRRLELVKVLSSEDEGVRKAAHITIYYLPLSEVLSSIQADDPVVIYIDDVIYSPHSSD